ncbi:MAG: IreB family regulatory phosphoprotein [Clostridiales bacterium]|nr:IreB family regulatory phosphoprotein [Clostridiales bacterium]
MKRLSETQQLDFQTERSSHSDISYIIAQVYKALKEKGYDPVNQIVGYILSGDPTYITGHNNARSLISKFERDELLEEIVDVYLKKTIGKK